jgi:methionyl-tRNA synthetase
MTPLHDVAPQSRVFYLTTPIYYVNAPPHLGHAYTTVVADAMCRYRRLVGDEVFFLTGTDEHGDKIAQAAHKAGETPQAFADRNSAAFRAEWDALGIAYDDFIRTTEARHRDVVQEVLGRLWARGDQIYFGKYGGHYCFGCERFYTDKEIADGKCPDHRTPLTYIEEENYFFRMSAYQDWLRRELEEHPDRVRPERYRNELLGFLREPLEDLCISRPRSRLEWGIPLPFDGRFVTYVWFDALINYVSALAPLDGERVRRLWPRALHLIGKDILKPHGIYWPCMLKAAGLPVYRGLRVHGYWSLGGGKMSKSVGNVVEALALGRKYGHDAFRYFVLREMPFGLDAEFSEEALVARLNADLANDLGNLVARATTLLATFGAKVEAAADCMGDEALGRRAAATADALGRAMEEFQFHRALAEIWSFIGAVNRYIDTTQPWVLAKRLPEARQELAVVLVTLAEALRFLGIVLEPFLPGAAGKIREAVGHEGALRLEEAAVRRTRRASALAVGKLSGLFPRVEEGARATPAAAPAAPSGAAASRISIDEFRRLDLRVAEVLDAERVPKSKRLLRLTVRLGAETRTLVAGIAEHYAPETLRGRKVVVVANLEPATVMGVTSDGMVLAGSHETALALVVLDRDLPSGAQIR